MARPKIVVEVDGGCVQRICCDQYLDADVVVLDWDSIALFDEEEFDRFLRSHNLDDTVRPDPKSGPDEWELDTDRFPYELY
jgi:hypothetical protein